MIVHPHSFPHGHSVTLTRTSPRSPLLPLVLRLPRAQANDLLVCSRHEIHHHSPQAAVSDRTSQPLSWVHLSACLSVLYI